MKKPLFLGNTYYADNTVSETSSVVSLGAVRKDYYDNKVNNLVYLVKQRYEWMNEYINENSIGLEFGSGHGLSKDIIKSKNFVTSDVCQYEWIDENIDALNINKEDSSQDFIIVSNVIHHLAQPNIFFKECSRVLKKDGLLIIQDTHASLMLRWIIHTIKHEGYSFEVNPFDKDAVCNNPTEPWSGNNAIPSILFEDRNKFEKNFNFKVIHHKYCEFLIFILSGGITNRRFSLSFPSFILNVISGLDKLLSFISNNIFSLQQQVVLKNNK